ncbi:hypothetical protein VHUM_04218 [Vanrija humicola]|uniref:Major facilitator superfamily (MFS) profile domain-containing protein n=1 Tax=Vanrija humicola TaxID=5417 RepID=A0A7D8Z2C2_VANHU|nr:hypothetical protein VHUM_04218 [Vanrija humicola]
MLAIDTTPSATDLTPVAPVTGPGLPLTPESQSADEHCPGIKSESASKVAEPNALASLGRARKNYLMVAFCLSMFIDSAGLSAMFLMTAPIADDLGIELANQPWVIGSYALAFASTLLFAGRLADLFPPSIVYTVGFLGMGILHLIISFMSNAYAFYVLRALSAVLGSLTVPSSVNMIVQMYPDPVEQGKKLGIFGTSGPLANTLVLIIAGGFVMASWRWYFRFIAILVVPFSIGAWFLMPRTRAVAEDLGRGEKWRRMDLGGVALMIAMLVCFILALTQGPLDGWNKPVFIAPIVISAVLFPVFIIWEQRMPRGYSMLPHDIWRFPNIFPLIIQATVPVFFFSVVQLRMASYFQDTLHESAIISGLKLFPMGVIAFLGGVITQFVPFLARRPRLVQPIAALFVFTGLMVLAYSNGQHYWRWIFPAEIVGTSGCIVIFIGMNTALIQAFPLEFAGVGGSFANVIFQLGGIIGVAVQTALVAGDGHVDEWKGTQNSYFFAAGWVLASGIIFALWFRQSKMPRNGSAQVAV